MDKLIKAVLILTLCSSIHISCNKDKEFNEPDPHPFSWKQIGLDGLKVNRLELNEDKLFAITSNGLHVMNINTEKEFSPLGLEGKNILDIAVLDEQHFLVSYRDINNWEETEIFESLDGGISWNIKEHNFGTKDYPETVTDFFWDSSNEVLYATGYGVLAKSSDKGTTWQPIWGDWAIIATTMMIEINPKNNADIWFGGQGGIENGYLINLHNDLIKNQWYDLVPNPTVPKEIVFDKSTPQNIYVGWEGELNKTSDFGNTWETLIDRHQEANFFFGIGLSENNPDLVFAGKWIKGAEKQALTLHYSKDGGDTWQEEIYPDEDQGGIFDLKIISNEGKERIFLALDKGGVYEIMVTIKDL